MPPMVTGSARAASAFLRRAWSAKCRASARPGACCPCWPAARRCEEFLYTHPDVEDVQVIGVPDEKYGEEPCAWIKMREGAEPLDAEAVKAFATGKLAHYKIPRYVKVVEEFPMTVTGKIRKNDMREQSTQELGLRPKG